MKLFSELVKMSKALTEDAPKCLRAFLTPLCFFGMIVFAIIISPLALIFKNRTSPYKKLEMDLETMWHSNSSTAALAKLREWRNRLKNDLSLMSLKGAKHEPYGTFRFNDYLSITNMLYHWEFRLSNYEEASSVCDEYLELLFKRNNFRHDSMFQYWAIQKAKTIKEMYGHLAAQKYLLQYIDTEQKSSQINKYFEELRAQTKAAV
jgi:hypothetical protein